MWTTSLRAAIEWKRQLGSPQFLNTNTLFANVRLGCGIESAIPILLRNWEHDRQLTYRAYRIHPEGKGEWESNPPWQLGLTQGAADAPGSQSFWWATIEPVVSTTDE